MPIQESPRAAHAWCRAPACPRECVADSLPCTVDTGTACSRSSLEMTFCSQSSVSRPPRPEENPQLAPHFRSITFLGQSCRMSPLRSRPGPRTRGDALRSSLAVMLLSPLSLLLLVQPAHRSFSQCRFAPHLPCPGAQLRGEPPADAALPIDCVSRSVMSPVPAQESPRVAHAWCRAPACPRGYVAVGLPRIVDVGAACSSWLLECRFAPHLLCPGA